MTASNEPDLLQQPSRWSDWRRRYLQKRYLLSWILAAVLPFIVLRLLFMSEIKFPFLQFAGSFPISFGSRVNVSREQSPSKFASSPAPVPDVEPILISDSDILTGGGCDLFEGEWEHDPEGPLYTNSSCFYMQKDQDCMSNGRPDTDYLYWKWKPRDCDLPRFDAESFMASFRGKAIGFIGDSIARNQMQSMLCLLSQVEIPVETYQSPDDQTVRWLFREHQITLAVVWAPYLLKHDDGGAMGFQEGENVLYLDVLDPAWTSVMHDFDVMVFLTGQWYYRRAVYVEQWTVIGCHYCPGLNLTEVGIVEAYRAGIRKTLEKVSDKFKGIAIMSTFPLSHFENGTWDSGGYCRRKQPLPPLESTQFPGEHNQFREIVIDEFIDVVRDNTKQAKDAHLEILDVTKLSLQRVDGHPGAYRFSSSKKRNPDVYYPNDCLHWCLPGPTETWNQIVVKTVNKYF